MALAGSPLKTADAQCPGFRGYIGLVRAGIYLGRLEEDTKKRRMPTDEREPKGISGNDRETGKVEDVSYCRLRIRSACPPILDLSAATTSPGRVSWRAEAAWGDVAGITG